MNRLVKDVIIQTSSERKEEKMATTTTTAIALPEIKTEGLSNLPAEIHFNFEELKSWLESALEKTHGLVVTDDNYKFLKQTRANITKVEKAFKAAGTEVKNKLLAPFAPFDAKVKELVKMCEDAHEPLDKSIKEVEAALRDKKQKELEAFAATEIGNAFGDCDPMFRDSAYWKGLVANNPSWLNATTSMKSAKSDISKLVAQCRENLDTLRATIANDADEIKAKAELSFSQNFDFAAAMREVNAYREEQRRIAERAAQIERERKEREEREAAARKAEEERRAAQQSEAAKAEAKADAERIEQEQRQEQAKAALAAKRAAMAAGQSAASAEPPPPTPPELWKLSLAFDCEPDKLMALLSYLSEMGISTKKTFTFKATLPQMKALRAYIDNQGIAYQKVGDVTRAEG